jgi:hypothetical protein
MAESKIGADSELFNTFGYKQTSNRPIIDPSP